MRHAALRRRRSPRATCRMTHLHVTRDVTHVHKDRLATAPLRWAMQHHEACGRNARAPQPQRAVLQRVDAPFNRRRTCAARAVPRVDGHGGDRESMPAVWLEGETGLRCVSEERGVRAVARARAAMAASGRAGRARRGRAARTDPRGEGAIVGHVHVRLNRVLGRLIGGGADGAREHGAHRPTAAQLGGPPVERRAEGFKVGGRRDREAAQQDGAVPVEEAIVMEEGIRVLRASLDARARRSLAREHHEREIGARRRADRLGQMRRLARRQVGAAAHAHGPRAGVERGHIAHVHAQQPAPPRAPRARPVPRLSLIHI